MALRRWRQGRRRRAIAEIIGAILLIALTIIAGVILWNFRINTPPSSPTVSFVIRSGGSNPAWGDPTDCQPWGYSLSWYTGTQSASALSAWLGTDGQGGSSDTWWGQCEDSVAGNFSAVLSSQFIITAHSPANLLVSDIEFSFVCHNASNLGGTTVLVNGSLSSMTWFPGVTSSPAPNAPYLGWCGNFAPGLYYTGSAYGTLYNRLGMFVPLKENESVLENGDTFILYVHQSSVDIMGRSIVPPLDFECVANAAGVTFSGENATNGCLMTQSGNPIPTWQGDFDDFHGAPVWCFTTPGACTIDLTYTGTPSTLLASIPVYSLAPAST